MTEKESRNYLYNLQENGTLPNNFTEEHSQYENAINFTMKFGYYNLNADE